MTNTQVTVSGDFSRIFEGSDYLAMINTPDEAACVLRGHLILEEFLHLWIDKITDTDDIFKGVFVAFKVKLHVSRNLGLDEDLYKLLSKVNDLRNKFGHRKGYQMEGSYLESLANSIDSFNKTFTELTACRDFHVYTSGKDQHGNPREKIYKYQESNNRMRFVIIFVSLMIKLSMWMQDEFTKRNIPYTIMAI